MRAPAVREGAVAMSDAPELATGTERKPYAPLPGDRVDIDSKHLRPALAEVMFGIRVATVVRATSAHGNDLAWVTLPGIEGAELVDVEALTLVWRRPAP